MNLLLPKILIFAQFYRRFIWLHILNVCGFGKHKRSYMYLFMEGNLKKGAKTVCSYLFYRTSFHIAINKNRLQIKSLKNTRNSAKKGSVKSNYAK